MKKVILLFFAACVCIYAAAQPQLAGKSVEVYYPKAFMGHVLKESTAKAILKDKKYGQTSQTKRFWDAYSDRSNNKLLSGPSAKASVCGTLDFNEKVRIANIENGYALVYVEPKEGVPYPQISASVTKRGYVNINNLLLWHTCPTDENNIYYKALLCVNLDQKSSDVGTLFYNPAGGSESKPLTTDMNFYFIMKREGNKSLLALQHSMDGSVDNVLVGWVTEGSYVPWNQRTCLEPTWDVRDVEAFTQLKASYKIYHEDDKQMKDKPAVTEDFTTRVKGKNTFKYRMRPHLLRFPILDVNETGDVYYCSTFGVAGEGNRNALSNIESRIDPNSALDRSLKDLSNINIAIVIDGTKSMGPYFQAVKEAIKDAEQYFESNKFKIRVGLVIYRDYSDGKGHDVEIFQLTDSKNPNLMKFLDNGGESGYGFKSSSRDKTLEEALYLGIDTALEQLDFNPKHSNLMFVVGDCGNSRNDNKFNRDDLVQKIVDKEVNLMGFQVNYGKAEAYDTFNAQIEYLMSKSIERKYRNINSPATVRWSNLPYGRELINSAKSQLYVGAHYSPSVKGEIMEASKLTSLMGEAINYCKGSISTQSETIYTVGFGGSNAVEATKIDEEFVKRKVGEDVFEQIKEGNNLLAFRGLTPKKYEGRNLYKPVLFISAQELEDLLQRLSGVNEGAAVNNDREPYINAMKALVMSYNPGMTEEQAYKEDLGETMKKVMGLNEAPAALKEYTLEDLSSKRKVSQDEYYTLVTKFSKKYEALNKLKTRPYDYTYRANGIVYYWLPVEDLP